MYLNKVIINHDVVKVMQEHADSHIPDEVGGHLLGIPCNCHGDPITWVIRAVPGDCESSRSHVIIKSSTFKKTWEYADEERLSLVGWYHTHPDFGVFLSGTDKNYTKMYYKKPHQIAIVIDPIRRERGAFGWTNELPNHLDYVDASIYMRNTYKRYFKK